MKTIREIVHQHTKRNPIILTLGFFDGMHSGHQKIFKKARDLKGSDGILYTLTFRNHPKTILQKEIAFPLISTLPQRLELIKEQQCDTLVLLEFTEEIKKCSADDFLLNLHECIPFDHLVLGPNATIGHKKEGNAELIRLLSKKYSFELHLEDYAYLGKERISSTLIRAQIKEGQLSTAAELLGRPYSIKSKVLKGKQIGRALGFPTINLDVDNLQLPPLGVYKVHLLHENKPLLGIANLGHAPTVQERSIPVLEVHLMNFPKDFDPQEAEVVFLDYLRAEKKFSSLDELKSQIHLDIESIQP